MAQRSIERFWQAVEGVIEPLEQALARLGSGAGEEAERSVRRMAHSLGRAAAEHGLGEIRRRADELAEAGSRRELLRLARKLMARIRDEREGRRTDPVEVLIVEDDPASARLLERAVAGAGHRTLVAETAAAAERAVEERTIDLILLDLILPDADGRDFLLKLREKTLTAEIPVLVVSARPAAQAEAECLALGAQEYLEKPLDPPAVRAAVERALAGESARKEEELEGLANRAGLAVAFAEARASAQARVSAAGPAPAQAPSFAAGPAPAPARSSAAHPSTPHPTAGGPVGKAAAEAAVPVPGGSGRPWVCLAALRVRCAASGSRKPGEVRSPGEAEAKALAQVVRELRASLEPTDVLAGRPEGGILALLPGRTAEGACALLEAVRGSPEAHGCILSGGVADVTECGSLKEAILRADRMLRKAETLPEGGIVCTEPEGAASPHRLLLAEDDAVTARLIRHRLEKEGFEVVHCADGEAAFEAARREEFSLAIFDVKMPGMDGFELLQRARALPRFGTVPVIMLTSMGQEEDIVRGFELGADDYVLKPFSPVELLARIHRLLDA